MNEPDPLLTLKERLEQAGFTTTWDAPLFKFVHPDWYFTPDGRRKMPEKRTGDFFYVEDLPIPRLAPFDLCAAKIEKFPPGFAGKPSEVLRFSLSFYFIKIYDGAEEPEEIYAREFLQDQSMIKIYEMFNDIYFEYHLEWDREYDDIIEETLYGDFPVDMMDKVIELFLAVRRKCLAEANKI